MSDDRESVSPTEKRAKDFADAPEERESVQDASSSTHDKGTNEPTWGELSGKHERGLELKLSVVDLRKSQFLDSIIQAANTLGTSVIRVSIGLETEDTDPTSENADNQLNPSRHIPLSHIVNVPTVEAQESSIDDTYVSPGNYRSPQQSTIFTSSHASRITKSISIGCGISAIVLAIGYGLSLLNPSDALQDVLILAVALLSITAAVFASDIVFKSNRNKEPKYIF